MMMVEACGGLKKVGPQRLKFFATDIDEDALEKARRGVYPIAALNDVPDEMAAKYLNMREDEVEVIPEIRSMVLFSVHNVAQDPPFLHIDLICCRNVLIYFGPVLHDRTLSNLHYGLIEDGMLFIGTADNASSAADLFSNVQGTGNILRKRTSDTIDYRARSRSLPYRRRQTRVDGRESMRPDTQINPLVKAIIKSIGGNAVLMTKDLQIIAVFGNLSGLISLKESSPPALNHSVLVEPLAHDVLMLTTMAARHETVNTGRPRNVDGRDKDIQVSVYPLKQDDLFEDLFMISFEDIEPSSEIASVQNDNPDAVTRLRDELDSARTAMNLAVEEWETANEELRSANEELQSNNEELQSMNEELETSNEELQSTNEELVSVNEVLQVTTNELTELNEEQDAILDQLANPLLIIDQALQVTKFSRSASEIFKLAPNTSRPHVSQLAMPRGFPSLSEICDETIRLGLPKSLDFVSEDRSYRLNCAPYANARGQIRGATLTFTPV